MKKRARLAILVLAAVVVVFMGSALLPAGGSGSVVVNVPEGSSARQIGAILASKGVVRSDLGFRLTARVLGKSGSLKSGAYEFKLPVSPLTVLHRIASGDVSGVWVTFPEGFTDRQMADLIQEKELGTSARFMAIAGNGPESMEGYLFPDTYLFPIGSSENDIIDMMRECFRVKVSEPLADDIKRSGMSLHETITLASLVEREAMVDKDRPLISAVLRNRLRKGMRLQCDATVLYALGKHKSRVYYKDLTVDSPYNTYMHEGLPPGPIANPGLKSIDAALHPADVDYLFYVARPDGSHVFSRTAEEHERAVREARGEADG